MMLLKYNNKTISLHYVKTQLIFCQIWFHLQGTQLVTQ